MVEGESVSGKVSGKLNKDSGEIVEECRPTFVLRETRKVVFGRGLAESVNRWCSGLEERTKVNKQFGVGGRSSEVDSERQNLWQDGLTGCPPSCMVSLLNCRTRFRVARTFQHSQFIECRIYQKQQGGCPTPFRGFR
jgi:hypothetical protein